MRFSFPLLMLSATAVQGFAPVPKPSALNGLAPSKGMSFLPPLKDATTTPESMAELAENIFEGERVNLPEEALDLLLSRLGIEDPSVKESFLKDGFSIIDLLKIVKDLLQTKPGDVLAGVTLPDNPQSDFNFFVAKKVVFYVLRVILTREVEGFEGNAKWNSLQSFHDVVISNSDLNKDLKGYPNYLYFGDQHYFRSLTELLKSNPFFASGLTKSAGGGYELITYSPSTPDEDKSRCLKVIDTLEHCSPFRANFYFNSDMSFKSFEVFDKSKPAGEQSVEVDQTDEIQLDKWASATIYHMLFYVSCQHATMHILHYIATGALVSTADKYEHLKVLAEWADLHANDIKEKYREVGSLLITDVPEDKPDLAIITGTEGFGASQAIRPYLLDMLNDWAENPTAEGWVNSMMNIDIDEMKENKILEQFWDHYALIPDFAREASQELKKVSSLVPFIHSGDGDKAEADLKEYLQTECGENFRCSISTFDEWCEMMAVTGIVHGCTLSYTRAIGVNDVLRWRTTEEYWDHGDFNLFQGGLGTLCGTEEGRHVMGGDNFLRKYLLLPDPAKDLKKIIDKYNGKAQLLKFAHLEDITKRTDFETLGWIWTDFSPEGFDGKQLTMTTYI